MGSDDVRGSTMLAAFASPCLVVGATAQAEDLFRTDGWAALASDHRAAAVGDSVTVFVVQSAESSTTMQSNSRRSSDLDGVLNVASISERAGLEVGGRFEGRGEVRRAETLITQLTVNVTAVLPNGDLAVAGRQQLNMNGEHTVVAVRGRIRRADLSSGNTITSNRIADAEIEYNGRGFVTRSSRPGLLQRIFAALGLG